MFGEKRGIFGKKNIIIIGVHSYLNNIINVLVSLNLKYKLQSSKTIRVLIDSNNRISTFQNIENLLVGSIWDKNPTSKSSLGIIRYKNYSIQVKPSFRQSSNSCGLCNEYTLNSIISHWAKIGLSIIFYDERKEYHINNILGSYLTGKHTIDRNKSDIIIETNAGPIPISIKDTSAEYWESSDTLYRDRVSKILQTHPLVKINKIGIIFIINPNIGISISNKEKEEIIFGKDKCIVIITKTNINNLNITNGILRIKVDNIITELTDIPYNKEPILFIRNCSTRRGIPNYPGIRAAISYKSRVTKNSIFIEDLDEAS